MDLGGPRWHDLGPAMLLPALADPTDAEAITAGGRSLSYERLRGAASDLAARLQGHARVAVWTTPALHTCAGVVGILFSGAAAVPVNPKIGRRDLEHVVRDSEPSAVVADPEATLPRGLADL